MIYEVIEAIRVRTPKGDTDLTAGQLINIEPCKAQRLVETGKLKPRLTEARKDSLIMCMEAVWDADAMPLYRQGFKLTPEITKAEDEVTRIQGLVQQGLARLSDHEGAVKKLISAIKRSTG